jgi:hypothetical protein
VTIHQSLYTVRRPWQAEQRRHIEHLAGDIHLHEQPEVSDVKSSAVDVASVIGFNQQSSCDFGIDLRLKRIDVDSLGGINLCHLSETGYISRIDQIGVMSSTHSTFPASICVLFVLPARALPAWLKPIKIS